MTSVIPCTCPEIIPSPASPPNTLKRDWSTDCMVVALFFAAAAPLARSSVILAKLCWALLIFPAKLCANSSLQLLLVSFRVPYNFILARSITEERLISPAPIDLLIGITPSGILLVVVPLPIGWIVSMEAMMLSTLVNISDIFFSSVVKFSATTFMTFAKFPDFSLIFKISWAFERV